VLLDSSEVTHVPTFENPSPTPEQFVVQTLSGRVQGKLFEGLRNKDSVVGFLGVPYAEPPIRELRFRVRNLFKFFHSQTFLDTFP